MRGTTRRIVGAASALAAAAALLAPAAGPAGAEPVRYKDVIFDDVEITRDLVYGEARNSRGEDQTLLYDLYEPVGDTATDRPLYIWVHGSGFRVGNKNSSANPLTDYATRGWVGMAINYRLRPEMVGFAAVGMLTNPDQIPYAVQAAKDAQHDLQAAVRYARAHADELGIDPDRIAVGGKSAGGIMSLMAAFNADDPGNSGTPGVSSHVAAAVAHAGAYVPVLLGMPALPGAPPIAMYHGTTDEQVPFPLAPPACVLTIVVGNTCEFVTFVARSHRGILGADLALDFLYRHVIQGPALRTPYLLDLADGLRALVGVETPIGPGVDVGAVVPTDPDLVIDETTYFVDYVLRALALPGL